MEKFLHATALIFLLLTVMVAIVNSKKSIQKKVNADTDLMKKKINRIFGISTESTAFGNSNIDLLLVRASRLGQNRLDWSSSVMKCEVIARKADMTHWLSIVYSDNRPDHHEPITELRARRALFLDPKRYKTVYGVQPHRDQLKPLIFEQDKLSRFDPNLHFHNFIESAPIGNEFGSRAS